MKIKKVLLVNPPYYVSKEDINFYPSFPLGMGYIASYLEKKGYSVKVIDAFGEGYERRVPHDARYLRIGLSDEEILSKVESFRPDIAGISNLFSIQHFGLHSMARFIKNWKRDLPVVAGGPHISAVPELVMPDENIDYGVIGEGERPFTELIGTLNNGGDVTALDNIAYRQGGKIKVNRSDSIIANLDEIPFPAWHLFRMDKYLNQKMSHGGRMKRRPFMTMLTSRGCPLNCFFCSVRDTWGRCLRVRSAENVVEEIKHLRERFGIRELIIVDDNFNFDVERLDKILDFFIKERKNFVAKVPNGFFIPRLNEEILLKMKKAGFYQVYFPVESGSEHVLQKIIRKPIKLDRVRELVGYCKKIRMKTVGYFILGLPGETKEEMQKTFSFARELRVEPYFSIATPFPGSDLYKHAREKGLLKSYEIDKCSDTYNINTTDWDVAELKKFIWREELRFNWKSILIFYVKHPLKLLKRVFGYAYGKIRAK